MTGLEMMRNIGGAHLIRLLPDPHPALRATFPGGEGIGAVRIRPKSAMKSVRSARAAEGVGPYEERNRTIYKRPETRYNTTCYQSFS